MGDGFTRLVTEEELRLLAIIRNLDRRHVCGGSIKPGRESCTRCGAEEDAAAAIRAR